MPIETRTEDAYRIGVTYGSDAESTFVTVKLMTGARGKWVVGHQFTTSSDTLDRFIDQIGQALGGIDVTRDLEDGSPLSILRVHEGLIFIAPVKLSGHLTRMLMVPMTATDASALAKDLDEVQDAINVLLGAGVVFLAAA